MKFIYPSIDHVFNTDLFGVNTIVIENKRLFCELVNDLYSQYSGNNGRSVVSKDDSMLTFSKNTEIFSSFVPFEINEKRVISKLLNELDRRAKNQEHYEKTGMLLNEVENYIDELSFDFKCEIEYNSLDFLAIAKAVGIRICQDSSDITENFLNYMETILDLEGEKLFITINMRSFVEDDKVEKLLNTVCSHRYSLLMIENVSWPKLDNEIRYTIDSDLCEF